MGKGKRLSDGSYKIDCATGQHLTLHAASSAYWSGRTHFPCARINVSGIARELRRFPVRNANRLIRHSDLGSRLGCLCINTSRRHRARIQNCRCALSDGLTTATTHSILPTAMHQERILTQMDEKGARSGWMRRNRRVLEIFARNRYDKLGRGAIVLRADTYSLQFGYPMSYIVRDVADGWLSEEIVKAIETYEPSKGFILVVQGARLPTPR